MYLHSHEPSLEELLDDPITRLLMARDGLHPEVAWEAVEDARRKLDARVERHSSGSLFPRLTHLSCSAHIRFGPRRA
jgi:hypothetical protein